jgi:hypothetical protein
MKKVKFYNDGFLYKVIEFDGKYELASKLYGTIEKYTTRFSFLMAYDSFLKEGVFNFDNGTYIELIK